MIKGTITYRQPKNKTLEDLILSLVQKHGGQRLGEFGLNEGRFELLVGFKKETAAINFKKDADQQLRFLDSRIEVILFIPKKVF